MLWLANSFFFTPGPPSACRNLRVYHPRTRTNFITVRWERSLITGRDDYHYNIYHSNPDIPGNFIRHNCNPVIKDSSVVQYSVSGLRPLTNYTIRVTVHNGVSDQDPEGEQGRRCEYQVSLETYISHSYLS